MSKPLTKKEINEAFDAKFTIEGEGKFIKESMPNGNFVYADDIRDFFHSQYALVLEGLEESLVKALGRLEEKYRLIQKPFFPAEVLDDLLKELQRIKDSLK